MRDRIENYKSKYHFKPEMGWINDPNGVIFYNGYYHIFYQNNPNDNVWNDPYWGHAITKDFIKYKHLPLALTPGKNYGCFSGGAIVDKNNILNLFYTRHRIDNGHEEQYKAISSDGINFIDDDKIVISKELLDNGCSKTDFRDPNPLCVDGVYYVCVGNHDNNGKGQLLIFKSFDLEKFTLHMKIRHEAFGTMLECPDMFILDKKVVLIFSSIGYEESNSPNGNKHGVYALVGDIDFENKLYHWDSITNLDYGSDLYAPQSLSTIDGRRIMIAWLEKWNNTGYLQKLQNITSGRFVLPRELYIENNIVKQKPVREIYDYMHDSVGKITTGTKLTSSYIKLQLNNCGILKLGNDKDYLLLKHENSVLYFTAKQQNHVNYDSQVSLKKENINVEIFIDEGSFEVFTESGESISSECFMKDDMLVLQIDNVIVLENKRIIVE